MSVKYRDYTDKALKTIQGLTAERFKEFADTVVEIAREEVPYITGNLRRSLSHDAPNSKLVRRIYTQTGYGGYVHEGTAKRNPNPFITRSIDRAMPEFNSSGPWA